MKNLILCFLILCCFSNLQGQRLIKFKEIIKFDSYKPEDVTTLLYRTLLPQTIEGRQEVISIKYSKIPSRLYLNGDKKYAEFTDLDPKHQGEIIINYLVKIYDNDLISARRHHKKRENEKSLSKYLKSNRHFSVKA